MMFSKGVKGRGLAVPLLAMMVPLATLAQVPVPTPFSPIGIVSPANHAVFRAPVDIPIFAYAGDFFLSVTNVEFYAGTNDLGPGTLLPIFPVLPTSLYHREQYSLVWTNPPPGIYALKVVISGTRRSLRPTPVVGGSVVSASVNITVLPSSPPATNSTDVVSLIATDPVAVAGTNCWVWRGVTNSTPSWTNPPGPIFQFFTNCGPKDATFLVCRFGDCSKAVRVQYTCGGTATNGVDYVALPGSVDIPQGQAQAAITLVPTGDGVPGVDTTVRLTLMASTNLPPDYLVGFPRTAAALILDSDLPRPATGRLPGNVFHLSTEGPDGSWFSVQYSTNLADWLSVCTNQVVDGSIEFVDPDAPTGDSRFYRAVPQNGPPLQ